jgi:hypothetical protein
MIPEQMYRRLAKLEAAFRVDQSAADLLFAKFWNRLLAYHVGGWQPDEGSHESAWLRALGYETRQEAENEIYADRAALNAREHRYSVRYESAMTTMFALENVDGKTARGNVVLEALGRLIEAAEKGGLPLGEKPPFPLALLCQFTNWPLI